MFPLPTEQGRTSSGIVRNRSPRREEQRQSPLAHDQTRHGNRLSLPITRRQLAATLTSIQCTGTDKAVVGILLEDVRGPATDPRTGNEIGEERQGEAQMVQDR